MLSQTFEEELFYEFIENDLEPLRISSKYELQRKKFQLINKLIDDLFHHKNSRDHYNLISNQLILLLTLSNEENPFDVFFFEEEDHVKEVSDIYTDILKSEFLGI